MHPNRRLFLAGSAAAAATAVLPGCATPGAAAVPAADRAAVPQPFFVQQARQKLLPRGKAPRIVICGGGWGGVTVAQNLRKTAPQAEVVLLERNPVFFSSPLSNLWLVDLAPTQLLTHDYLTVSERHGWRFFQAEVTQVDRARRLVHTSLGQLDYDWLILAPGIRYNYEAWFGNDRAAADATRQRFPSAYASNAEHWAIKRALHEFKGGEWVMNLPPPPQRCPPSPYERACMIAWHFKKHGIKARLTILDHKPDITPIGPGYHTAFRELYKDIITYVPNAHVQEVDPFNKRIRTSAGDMRFDHAVLMAPHQAGDLAWQADAIGLTPQGQATGWADTDPLKLHLRNDDRCYVIGDAIGRVSDLPFGFYPKSAHVANRLGRIVAYFIGERIAGRTPGTRLPDNLCYMAVNGDPAEAINVQFDYKLNDQGQIVQQQIDFNERSARLFKDDFLWAGHMFHEMFGTPKPA
ncbi:MAG: FAD/NAD(P)-binding oxidoreductase [Comamonadaceae bacterium]|nr:FAD/NAD(P)-binding oxidoreductase [Comamonadaceae bacterium]